MHPSGGCSPSSNLGIPTEEKIVHISLLNVPTLQNDLPRQFCKVGPGAQANCFACADGLGGASAEP